MSALTLDQLREFHLHLAHRGHVLVEVDGETRWRHWEEWRDPDDDNRTKVRETQRPLLQRGYVLAKASKSKTLNVSPRNIYVSDVNDRHAWHAVVTEEDRSWHRYRSVVEAARDAGVL
jgi:hypothetical protein